MSVDNSDIRPKIAVRRQVAAALPDAGVLDCYSGTGVMAREAWAGRKVTRIDAKPIQGVHHVGNNLAIAPKLAATGSFGVFDLDAYGNPWPLYKRIVDAVPAGRYAFAITCGIRRGLIHSSPWVASELCIPGGGNLNLLPFYDDIILALIHCGGISVDRILWTAPKKTGLTVRYFGVLLTKTATRVASGPPRTTKSK